MLLLLFFTPVPVTVWLYVCVCVRPCVCVYVCPVRVYRCNLPEVSVFVHLLIENEQKFTLFIPIWQRGKRHRWWVLQRVFRLYTILGVEFYFSLCARCLIPVSHVPCVLFYVFHIWKSVWYIVCTRRRDLFFFFWCCLLFVGFYMRLVQFQLYVFIVVFSIRVTLSFEFQFFRLSRLMLLLVVVFYQGLSYAHMCVRCA